uniref:FGGY_C domain-containing protein n=1 Tax=Macrostomum lignano TaxID=282301 RepID=A0A1I8FW51_9PLAT
MRNSVTAWERDSGKPLMPIISWQDRRAGKDCAIWNRSLRMRAFRAACWALYKLTGRAKFLAASVLQFKIGMPVIQLVKLFAENPALLERARRGEICLEWSPIVVSALLHMPLRMLPEVQPTAGQFGHTDLFPGGPVDITSISGDQSAATFGELCHQPDQVKVTLGTGTFLDWNTGKEPYASMKGLYPVIGWVIDGDQSGPTYMIEGSHADTGNTLDWGCAMGFYPSVSEAESAALTVADSGGVFFVPCFTWSAVPVFDPAACAGFLGVNLGTSREHMARALLEAVIFQTKAIAEAFRLETGKKPAVLRCNGGVSASDFIMQGIADLLDCDVVRGSNREATSLGCAFLTAIAAGLWSQAEIGQRFDSIERRFQPRPEAAQRLARDYEKWKVAVQRFK